jgi:acetyl esterase/lipase
VEQAASNVRGAVIDIVVGENDPYLSLTEQSVDDLRDAGAEVGIEVVPGLAHDFPTDFAERLTRHLDTYPPPT